MIFKQRCATLRKYSPILQCDPQVAAMSLCRGNILIEMILVVGLVAVGSGLCMYGIIGIDRYTLSQETHTLSAAFRFLRARALITHKQQHLTFHCNPSSYTIDDQEYVLADGVYFGTIPRVKGPPSQPTHVITNPITFAQHVVTIAPTGIIRAGTVYLTNAKQQYAISAPIAPYSHIREYTYHNNKWQYIG